MTQRRLGLALALVLAFGNVFACGSDDGPTTMDAGTELDGGSEMDSGAPDADRVDSGVDGGRDAGSCVDEDDDGYGEGCALGPDCDDANANASPAGTEVCDGADNDCDDATDEGCPCENGATQACGSSVGACERGTQVCVGSEWGACTGGVTPVAETCNGLDDDCNGVTDDALVAPACALTEGVCEGSTQVCAGAAGWTACAGTVSYGVDYVTTEDGAASEAICDGLDNDCDGTTDEGCSTGCSPAACDDGVSCTEDVCSEDGRCVHLLLESACARGQYCDLDLGCVDGTVCSSDAECADSDPCTTMERCDMSFPRRCTHRILDADADRETTLACGGGDCNDASTAVSMMAHQVCGSAVDADCDGLVALDDLIGTTACANDVFAGGLAACPVSSLPTVGPFSPLVPSDYDLDVRFCENPLGAVQDLAACMSSVTCEEANSCTLTYTGLPISESIFASFTDCREAFRDSCNCAAGTERCEAVVPSLCSSECAPSESPCFGRTPVDVTGAPPTFDVCRDLNNDANNCGACGNECPDGNTCTGGTCCRPTDLECDGNPATPCETDTLTSDAHCGACGNACSGGASCVAGVCTCPMGQTLCDGRCITPDTDPMNCGACGNVCSAPEGLCIQGQCNCDFFEQACGDGNECALRSVDSPSSNRARFGCVPARPENIPAGGGCPWIPFGMCISGADCVRSFSASPYCQRICRRSDGVGCNPGETCRSWYEGVATPAGYGICCGSEGLCGWL